MRRRASILAAMGVGAAVFVGARWLVRAPRGAKQASPAPSSDPSGPVAGEFDRSYFDAALPQRFAHAQRRLQPISLVLVGIESPGTDPRAAFDALVSALRSTIRASDTVCRIGPDRLGLILEDATEYGAVFAVERARNVLLDAGREHDIVVGVASYPSHAMALDELVDQAEDALQRAREHPRARFSVADAKP